MRSTRIVGTLLATALLLASAGISNAGESKADRTTSLTVRMALLNQLGSDGMKVEVDSDTGAVTLSGTTGSPESRASAETVAKSVSGVKSVQNDLVLATGAAPAEAAEPAAGAADVAVRDAVLATRVRLALVRKLGAEGYQIGTTAADGVVTLRFSSEFTAKRQEVATKTAKNVPGVTKIFAVRKA